MSGLTGLLLAAAFTSTVLPSPEEQAEMYGVAGFVRVGDAWRTPDCRGLEGASYSPGTIDSYGFRLNLAEAVISEGSAVCYGLTGSRFWFLAKSPAGKWRVMASEIGLPDFLETSGTDGWPDIQVGGPGFCFPVLRWDGTAYRPHRHQYEGKACKP
ncbi:hypothetical protein H9L13_10755 [Sphingomonas lutea]|uniref:Uncharacterized protein n=1 Tax=Sphingomonas lutea TaxID=1045317 RepID=A0A7G9SGX2_9SPHN|nr:hypothetical protein [Sphingomonas lutea]QNN67097.1 hypothetical protein H9L13_10755 [Sphingomonas lutea]